MTKQQCKTVYDSVHSHYEFHLLGHNDKMYNFQKCSVRKENEFSFTVEKLCWGEKNITMEI